MLNLSKQQVHQVEKIQVQIVEVNQVKILEIVVNQLVLLQQPEKILFLVI